MSGTSVLRFLHCVGLHRPAGTLVSGVVYDGRVVPDDPGVLHFTLGDDGVGRMPLGGRGFAVGALGTRHQAQGDDGDCQGGFHRLSSSDIAGAPVLLPVSVSVWRARCASDANLVLSMSSSSTERSSRSTIRLRAPWIARISSSSLMCTARASRF